MLKHCSTSTSCADLSRRSLRNSSLALHCEGEKLYRQSGYCLSLYTLPRSSAGEDSLESETSLSETEDREAVSLTNTIRVYANCLRPHLAYKTIMISVETTSREVITGLLARFRMRHRWRSDWAVLSGN